MPYGISALSAHPILFSEYRGPRILNDASAADDAAAKAAADEKAKADADAKAKADADAKAKADADKSKDDTEGRISKLVEERNELRKWKKEKEEAEKKAEEERLAKKGEHETLAKQREAERDTEKKAREEAEAKLAKYEEDAKKRIKAGLDSITDADRRKAAEKMLAGRATEDQIELLPEVMKLAGAAAPAGFGGPTPTGDKTPSALETDQKQKRFNELLAKRDMTPEERSEFHRLTNDLQKVWDEKKQKGTT